MIKQAERVRSSFEAEGVALVCVSGPPPNPSTFGCVEALANTIETARDDGARIVVIASDVPDHWLGHASLRDLTAMMRGQETSGDGGAFFRVSDLLAKSELVSIAAISGDCGGGGCEIGWACDLRVAEEQARFSQMEILAGLIPGLGGIARLSKLIGRTATSEIVLDGAQVSARRLYELGAINRVVASGRATETALEWAKRLAERPADALARAKRVLSETEDLPLSEALANEQREFQKIAATPGAMELMDEIQAQYDAGVIPPRVLVDPFED